jgi:dTDP-4-amino-4,6-dideoxygalactose transaminase
MIPLFKVFMSDEAVESVAKTLKSGYIAEGQKVADFEYQISKFLGNKNIALTDTCTSAITIALKLSGVGVGDEVITTPMTCLATNQPILSAGAIPVWCDIEKETLNIDAYKIESLITEKTKAIICVHYGGIPCDMEHIQNIAKKHNLKVIADCAHAWTSEYRGNIIGSGKEVDFSCFSMGPIKHFNSIEGGVLSCANKEDAERARLLRWYAHDRLQRRTEVRWDADVVEYGYKFNLNDVNATVGMENLKHLDVLADVHKSNARYYQTHILNSKIKKMSVNAVNQSAWWIYNILLENKEERQRFVDLMKRHRVAVSIVHTRNDTYKLFEDYKSHLPIMDYVADRYIAIPVGWHVTEEDREYIVDIINEEF